MPSHTGSFRLGLDYEGTQHPPWLFPSGLLFSLLALYRRVVNFPHGLLHLMLAALPKAGALRIRQQRYLG